MYSEITRKIKVIVEPAYLEDQSCPEDNYYVWAYHVRIENNGTKPVRLVQRHWKITDSSGKMQEVHGQGVVGEQPVLDPGSSFEYASGTPLNTPSGFMAGTYEMATDDGEQFHVTIPTFSLDCPSLNKQLH
jgi:ApaG protein